MAQINKHNLAYVLTIIIASAFISSVSSQCCDFYSSSCLWDTTTWRQSLSNQPNTAVYPSFVASEPDPYFFYIQDAGGYAVSTSTFYIPSDGTVISFDYFLDSPYTVPNNYFYVEFYNSAGSYSTWLLTINTLSTVWQHAQVICNYENNYCCGSTDKLPCSGTLRFVANVDPTYQQALIAIDNVGTTCSSVPTSPPPSPNCCSFDSDSCGSIGTWYWSYTYPSPYIPAASGYFEWTSSNNAHWYSALQSGVSSSTLFTFQFYIQSPNAQLTVGFREYSSGTIYTAAILRYVAGTWSSYSFNCLSCCGVYFSCSGEVFVTSYIPDGTEVAIDNVGRDNSCYGAYSCCLFDDSTICGAKSIPYLGYQWLFSGSIAPAIGIPSPGSNYVYFEAINNAYVLNAELQTEIITINYNSVFRGNFYIYNPYYPSNALNINFYNTNTGATTTIASLSTTSSNWEIIQLSCVSGNCCQGASTCTGYVEFVAVVNTIGTEVIFAIDAIDIDGSCGSFPGSTNSTQIKLLPRTA